MIYWGDKLDTRAEWGDEPDMTIWGDDVPQSPDPVTWRAVVVAALIVLAFVAGITMVGQ